MPVTKTLTLTSVSCTATTYEFRSNSVWDGWAICTINDKTGELAIVSDYGNWSYLWNPRHLGTASLTHFIAQRGAGDLAYLVNKLLGRRGCERFDAARTTAHLLTLLSKQRLADGQEYNARLREYGDDRDQEIAVRHGFLDKNFNGRCYMTAIGARDLWGQLEDLDDVGDGETAAALYCERFTQLVDHGLISDQVWEELQHVESHESKALRNIVLPALREACILQIALDPYVRMLAEYTTMTAAREAQEAREIAGRAASATAVLVEGNVP